MKYLGEQHYIIGYNHCIGITIAWNIDDEPETIVNKSFNGGDGNWISATNSITSGT